MPVVSAVTPCLNDGAYLQEMIESFLAQDYPHKELVVQDGGSTDGTHEILRRATPFGGMLHPIPVLMTRLTRLSLPVAATSS